jgi:spore coat protein U-like protein
VTMRHTFPVLILGILASGTAVSSIHAATASASFSVSAMVQASCQVSATATAFRTYAAAADAATAVSVACSRSAPYEIAIGAPSTPFFSGDLRETAGSGIVPLEYALGTDLRIIVNRGQQLNAHIVARSDRGSAPLLVNRGQLSSAKYATTNEYADTMMVVVTY